MRLTLNLSNEVLGPELVVDGVFAAACGVNWTCGGIDEWVINGGNATHAPIDVNWLYQNIGAINGKTYRVKFEVSSRTAGGVSPAIGNTGPQVQTNGTFIYDIVASNAFISMQPTSTFDGNIDNISVKERL